MHNTVRQRLDVFIYASSTDLVETKWPNGKLVQFFNSLPQMPSAERLAALIYKHANQRGHLQLCSAKTLIWLKQYTFAVIVDVEEKKAVLRELANTLTDEYPVMMLLKGMAFNDRWYTSEAPRGTSDIDFLIAPNDKNQFEKLFSRQSSKIISKSDKAFDGLFEQTWQSNYKTRVYFDIHWHLSYPGLFHFDQEGIAKRSIQHPLYKHPKLRVMSNEDQLVNLAIHLMRDCDFYDYGLLDCHELICNQNMDLERVIKIAKQWRAKTCLFYLLWLCELHLNTPITKESLSQIKPNSVKHILCKSIIKQWLVKPTKIKTNGHRLKQFFVVFLFSDSVFAAIRLYYLYALKYISSKVK
ncbi:nucleotidyltransferase family protein [Paraglaciecola sp. L3A3]|uniref:nucleotidyltransferase family protein n=1 Tax=Paraglaciecola sp. L3A3 TaxID=2686358 RepID=UPI00131AB7D6|nr:nucleotidyltransferase family protein [Paraglaciecola sp. L3A3]